MKPATSCLVAAIILSTFTGGCVSTGAVRRIDGSSQETTNKSLQQLSDSLPSHDRCLLQAAILRIQLGDSDTWKAGDTERKEKTNPLGSMIDGMTFQNILDLSQRYPDKAGNPCKP